MNPLEILKNIRKLKEFYKGEIDADISSKTERYSSAAIFISLVAGIGLFNSLFLCHALELASQRSCR